MSKIPYNKIVQKTVIVHNGEPYEVLSSHVFRKQKQKAVNQTKLRALSSGKVVEITFQQSDVAEEADIEVNQAEYLYTDRNSSWFKDADSERISVPIDVLGDSAQWLKENEKVSLRSYEDEVISVDVPIKVDLKVTDAPPAVKGNTAQGGTKIIELETGAKINAPMFINNNDIVRVNTESGEYTERVEKA